MIGLPGGEPAFYYGQWPGASDRSPGVRIGLVRSADGGRTWTKPETVFHEPGYDLYHASTVRMKTGEIGLTYTKRRHRQGEKLVGEKVFRRSADDGRTWSGEVTITDGDWEFYQTSACDRLVELESGRLVHPISRCLKLGDPEKIIVCHVYASDDGGRTWQRKTPVPLHTGDSPEGGYFHETSIVEWAPGKLLMLGRTTTGWLWESRSEDDGGTWSPAARSPVRGPVAPPLVENVPGTESILLVWNPITGTTFSQDRRVLASQISDDGGRTWHGYRQIEYGPHARSYASGLWVGDTLHLTYMDFGLGMNTRYLTLSKAWLLGT
jgi:hypothetical protein